MRASPLLLCFLLFHVAVAIDSKWIREQREKLPRYTLDSGKLPSLSFDKAPDTFCGVNNSAPTGTEQDCDTRYFEAIGVIVGFAALAGIVFFFFGVAFVMFRICNGCGGWRPSTGYCCFKRTRKDLPAYKKRTKYMYLMVLIGINVASYIFLGVGLKGNTDMTASVDDFGTVIVNTVDDIIARVLKAGNDLIPVNAKLDNPVPDLQSRLDNITTEAYNVRNDTVKVKEDALDANKYREDGIYIGFIACAGVIALGLLGYFFPYIAFIAAMLSLTPLLISWISFGMHLGVSTVVADLCVQIDDYLATNRSSIKSLDLIINCNNGSAYTDATNFTDTGLQEASSQGCSLLSNLCSYDSGNFFNCSAFTVGNCNRTNFVSFVNSTTTVENGLTLAQCANGSNPCNNTGAGTDGRYFAGNATDLADVFTTFENVFDELFEPLLDCSLVRNAFRDLTRPLCVSFVEASDLIMAMQGSFAIMLGAAAILLFRAEKRFRKQNTAEDDILLAEEYGGVDL